MTTRWRLRSDKQTNAEISETDTNHVLLLAGPGASARIACQAWVNTMQAAGTNGRPSTAVTLGKGYLHGSANEMH